MSLYDRIQHGGQPQINLQQLRNDPVGAAKQAGYNIPQDLAGNPQAMVQHLIQSGQIGGTKLQQVMKMMQRMGLK